MSNFSDADRASKTGGEKPEWKVIAVLDEIKKNKSDTLRITRVNFANKDLINLQIWRKDQDTGKSFPLREQSLSFNIELRDKVVEAISKAE